MNNENPCLACFLREIFLRHIQTMQASLLLADLASFEETCKNSGTISGPCDVIRRSRREMANPSSTTSSPGQHKKFWLVIIFHHWRIEEILVILSSHCNS